MTSMPSVLRCPPQHSCLFALTAPNCLPNWPPPFCQEGGGAGLGGVSSLHPNSSSSVPTHTSYPHDTATSNTPAPLLLTACLTAPGPCLCRNCVLARHGPNCPYLTVHLTAPDPCRNCVLARHGPNCPYLTVHLIAPGPCLQELAGCGPGWRRDAAALPRWRDTGMAAGGAEEAG